MVTDPSMRQHGGTLAEVTCGYGSDQNQPSRAPARRRITLGKANMPELLTTFGVILLFATIFAACILWATHGHPSNADNEDLGVVGKDH